MKLPTSVIMVILSSSITAAQSSEAPSLATLSSSIAAAQSSKAPSMVTISSSMAAVQSSITPWWIVNPPSSIAAAQSSTGSSCTITSTWTPECCPQIAAGTAWVPRACGGCALTTQTVPLNCLVACTADPTFDRTLIITTTTCGQAAYSSDPKTFI